eukprot:CAMPEP_0181271624 /NCGR_PEP_ID=MMETSP1097-20121128/7507_1 /TAXON_ID=35684 /ORGANISM="Pseudopedinella elastica, Strain CCMP716" /LENGTH=74 /DNA_ID=CAMNT_0023372079 /DNA_START=92 /DNA_END=313 /DNA_ORIENTATION=-
MAFGKDICFRQLCFLAITHVVKVKQLADFFEREPKALTAQDQFQARAVAFCEKAFLPFTDREQQFLCFVKAKRA